jgi:carbamoyltransferase
VDNAAAIIVDGQLVAAVEEERLNRIKHAPHMPPAQAIEWCLVQAGCELGDVDVIAVGFDHPRTIFSANLKDTIRRTALRQPHGQTVRGEYGRYRRHRFRLSSLLTHLGVSSYREADRWVRDGKLVFVRHHLAHAASAFFLSSFDEANILSLDGMGGQDAGLIGIGRGVEITPLEYVDRETSWGIVYERFTSALGFRRHNDEGKVMGLAAYGDSNGEIFPFIDLRSRRFPSYDGAAMYAALAKIGARAPSESPINGYHENIAATLQFSLEEAIARMTEVLHGETGLTDFCLAGGVALNCSANGKLLQLPWVKRIFVQPAAADSGTALGAAVYAHVQRTGERPRTNFSHAYWGPEYSNDEIEKTLREAKVEYRRCDDVARETADLIADEKIVGWFQGRMEVGPRALGARSILADPRKVEMKDVVNRNAKFREPWRPFAPSILAEHMEEYFGTAHPSPFMILAFDAREEVKAQIPATLHVDGTGRPQTVEWDTNPRFWELIDAFRQLTGVPVVLNTSFNIDSEPIVCAPRDALRTYYSCGIDALAIGDFLLEKLPRRSRDRMSARISERSTRSREEVSPLTIPAASASRRRPE